MKIILASKSPRRIELFKNINLDFNSINPKINEKKFSLIKSPSRYCMKLAEIKASTIHLKYADSLVIGADTIVYLNKSILEKPKNKKEAFNTLKKLSDKTHSVYTGVSIYTKNTKLIFFDKTNVTFYPLSNNTINHYINNYNPFDKAGSYGIQDWSKIFIKKINGCYYNVVGFPIAKFYKIVCQNFEINNILKSIHE